MSDYHRPRVQDRLYEVLRTAQLMGLKYTRREMAVIMGHSVTATQRALVHLSRRKRIAVEPYAPRGIEVLNGEAP